MIIGPAPPTEYDVEPPNKPSKADSSKPTAVEMPFPGRDEARMDEDGGRIGAPPPHPPPPPPEPAFSGTPAEQSETPPHPALEAELRTLSKWGTANSEAAEQDTRSFWYLKAPAVVLALVAALCSHYGNEGVATVATILIGTLIIVDGLLRPGLMRNARFLAFYEARELENRTISTWRAQILLRPLEANAIAAALIQELSAERNRMSAALKLVEANGPIS